MLWVGYVVVVSFGSINVDKVTKVTKDELRILGELDSFPVSGETVEFEKIPSEFDDFDFRVFLGGKGANQAIASGKAGSKTILLGKVGRDSQKYSVIQKLSSRGVETSEIVFSEKKTGCTHIFIDEEGENRICYLKGANKDVNKNYVNQNLQTIHKSDVLLLQNEINTETTKHLLKKLENNSSNKSYVIFDPSPINQSRELLKFSSIDLITPNEVEYQELRSYIDGFDGDVLKTLGEDGAEINGEKIRAPKVESKDTTAAGDVLNGYIASQINKGQTLKKSIKQGIKAATQSTKKIGAQNSIPTKKQINSYKTQ